MPNPISVFTFGTGRWLFLAFPQFLSKEGGRRVKGGGGCLCWITVLGALIHIWRPEITEGCDVSCLIWQEIFSFHKAKAFSQIISGNVEGLVPRRIL